MHWNVLDLKCNCNTTLYLLKCNVGCCCCTSMHCQYAPQVTTRVLLKLSVYIILETHSVKFYLRIMFQSSWLWNWSGWIFPGRLFSGLFPDYLGILPLRSKKRKKQFDDYFLFSSFIFGLKFDRGQFGWVDLSKPFCPTHHLTGPRHLPASQISTSPKKHKTSHHRHQAVSNFFRITEYLSLCEYFKVLGCLELGWV